jgi:hypothetical protein
MTILLFLGHGGWKMLGDYFLGMDAFRVDSDDEWDDLDGFVGEMICTWGFNMIQTT